VDLGQRESPLLLVDCFGPYRRVVAGAFMGRKDVESCAGGGLFVVLTLAGALDVFALVTSQGEYQEFESRWRRVCRMIKQQTPLRATILHAPIHNTPVFLTGRRSLMGYPGHIWTHGIDFGPRETDIKKIYSGSPDRPRACSANTGSTML